MAILPTYSQDTTQLDKWMLLMKKIIDRPVPAELETYTEDFDTIEERNKTFTWKLKGVACHLAYRIFQKYGNIKLVEEHHQNFTKHVMSNYAKPLLNSFLGMFFKRRTNFIGSKSLNYAIKYIG